MGRFFSHDYASLSDSMRQVQCRGNTNYEEPLSLALEEFSGGGRRHSSRPKSSRQALTRRKPCDQHILFITDGHPSDGDKAVEREIADARSLGVAVHTVFIGYGECPDVLDEISIRTKGSRHAAQFVPGTYSVRVRDRSSISQGEWTMSL